MVAQKAIIIKGRLENRKKTWLLQQVWIIILRCLMSKEKHRERIFRAGKQHISGWLSVKISGITSWIHHQLKNVASLTLISIQNVTTCSWLKKIRGLPQENATLTPYLQWNPWVLTIWQTFQIETLSHKLTLPIVKLSKASYPWSEAQAKNY